MTDKEYNFEKARILKYLKKWHGAGFGWFTVDYTWHRHLKDGETITAMADTSTDWEYRRAYINWYLPMFQGVPDERCESTVVHELSHILVASTSNFSTDEDRQMTEYATSLVASALIWAGEFVNDKKSSTKKA